MLRLMFPVYVDVAFIAPVVFAFVCARYSSHRFSFGARSYSVPAYSFWLLHVRCVTTPCAGPTLLPLRSVILRFCRLITFPIGCCPVRGHSLFLVFAAWFYPHHSALRYQFCAVCVCYSTGLRAFLVPLVCVHCAFTFDCAITFRYSPILVFCVVCARLRVPVTFPRFITV